MKKLFISCIAALTILSAKAQTNLSGTWTFEKQESISGKLYANGSPHTVTISQDAKQITVEKVTAADNGNVTVKETLAYDGKPFETTTASKKKKVIILTKSGDKIIETASYTDPGTNKPLFKTIDTWSVESGQLILDRKTENQENNETWESKAYYNKQ